MTSPASPHNPASETAAAVLASVLLDHGHPGELLAALGDAWMICGCGHHIEVAVIDGRAQIGDANREWAAHVAREQALIAADLLAANLPADGGATLDATCDQCQGESWTCSGCGAHRDPWDWPTKPTPATLDAGERAAWVEQVLKERLNEVMIGAQGSLAEDRCEVLHPDDYDGSGPCIECAERAAGLLHDGWDEQIIAPVRDALAASPTTEAAEQDDWPCDDYEAPVTCWTVPTGRKVIICDGCRETFPNGSRVQAIYRHPAPTTGDEGTTVTEWGVQFDAAEPNNVYTTHSVTAAAELAATDRENRWTAVTRQRTTYPDRVTEWTEATAEGTTGGESRG